MHWPKRGMGQDHEIWAEMAGETALCAQWRLRRKAGMLDWAAPMYKLHGVEKSAFQPTPEAMLALFHADDRRDVARLWALAPGDDVTLTARLCRGDGALRHLRLRAKGHGDDVLGLSLDITAQTLTEARLRELTAALRALAREDGLTGLTNRRHFELALAGEFKRAMRSNQPLGLVLADIDHLRAYNRCFGRDAGDALLRQAAQAFKAMPRRAGDVLARYDKAVFALLLPLADGAGALHMAEVMGQTMRALAVPHPAGEGGIVTLSCGTAVFTGLSVLGNPIELLHRAERALSQAKHDGRNRVRRDELGMGLNLPFASAVPLVQGRAPRATSGMA